MQYFHIDAFTDTPFRGNPAGVCLLEQNYTDDILQNIAFEVNLSETAFLLPEGDNFRLRWFTPKTEMNLCGHATLAAAHLIWSKNIRPRMQDLYFNTRSGVLVARSRGHFIELEFPLIPVHEEIISDECVRGYGIDPKILVSSARTSRLWLLELKSFEYVQALKLQPLNFLNYNLPDLIVTSLCDGKLVMQNCSVDIVSRFFAPNVGIPEDPVTGSAHCVLMDYWFKKLGKSNLNAYQASPRGGFMQIKKVGDSKVSLLGQAVIFLESIINI